MNPLGGNEVGVENFSGPVMHITKQERPTFYWYFNHSGFGLQGLISMPEIIKDFNERLIRAQRRRAFSPEESSLLDKLIDFRRKLDFKGGMDFRYVDSTPDLSPDQIVGAAEEHGGKSPKDSADAVCVDDCAKIESYLNQRGEGPYVLFIYDQSKLKHVPKAEATDWRHLTYAKRPAPGLRLRDALIGSIIFD